MDPSREEQVVLVDEDNTVLGTMPKALVHGATTPLHRAFSLFLFTSRGELLVQQRSRLKKTWPLVWSNSVCGHPGIHESVQDAARRRLAYELGISEVRFEEELPYRYCFIRDGIMENEICPVIVGFSDQTPDPRPDEVERVRYVLWADFLAEIAIHPGSYSEWCEEEARLVARAPSVLALGVS